MDNLRREQEWREDLQSELEQLRVQYDRLAVEKEDLQLVTIAKLEAELASSRSDADELTAKHTAAQQELRGLKQRAVVMGKRLEETSALVLALQAENLKASDEKVQLGKKAAMVAPLKAQLTQAGGLLETAQARYHAREHLCHPARAVPRAERSEDMCVTTTKGATTFRSRLTFSF